MRIVLRGFNQSRRQDYGGTCFDEQNSQQFSELKKNPMAVLAQGEGESVAILNRNKPAFYCVPARAYEELLDQLEDNGSERHC